MIIGWFSSEQHLHHLPLSIDHSEYQNSARIYHKTPKTPFTEKFFFKESKQITLRRYLCFANNFLNSWCLWKKRDARKYKIIKTKPKLWFDICCFSGATEVVKPYNLEPWTVPGKHSKVQNSHCWPSKSHKCAKADNFRRQFVCQQCLNFLSWREWRQSEWFWSKRKFSFGQSRNEWRWICWSCRKNFSIFFQEIPKHLDGRYVLDAIQHVIFYTNNTLFYCKKTCSNEVYMWHSVYCIVIVNNSSWNVVYCGFTAIYSQTRI